MYFFYRIFAVFVAVAMAGTAVQAESFKRIKSEADFRKLVVDKQLSMDDGSVMMVNSDGTTKGRIFKKNFAANWVWKNQMYCRNAVLGKQQLGVDCQVVGISGTDVQFIREYGKGSAGVMSIR